MPTLLTILGVIMFLRAGWVVGNAGLGGAWLIITVSFLITGCTGLSMSCFVTNIRVGSGGAFSMISQSLGLEVGGSIGIPLYLAQVLAVGMYVFGFREGWEGELNLIVAVDQKKSEDKAKKFLGQLSEAARLPGNTKVLVADGDFGRFSSKAPRADINFFPLGKRLDAEFMKKIRDQTDSACLFSQDSGTESALA